jgi:hypothetical protein
MAGNVQRYWIRVERTGMLGGRERDKQNKRLKKRVRHEKTLEQNNKIREI